jgi:hypothetical protein
MVWNSSNSKHFKRKFIDLCNRTFQRIDFTNKLETANITVIRNNDYSDLEKIKINAITHSLILANEINLKNLVL